MGSQPIPCLGDSGREGVRGRLSLPFRNLNRNLSRNRLRNRSSRNVKREESRKAVVIPFGMINTGSCFAPALARGAPSELSAT